MAGLGYADAWVRVALRDARRAVRRRVARYHLLVACLAYYALMVVTGMVGLVDPSLAITTISGSGYLVFAVGMMGAGTTGIFSVLAGHRRSETWCLGTIGLLTVIHGGMLIAAGDAGYVSGTRLVAGMFGCYLIGFYRSQTAATRADVRRQIVAAQRAEHAATTSHLEGGRG